MSDKTWNERFAQDHDLPGEPALLLKQKIHLLPRGGKALDLAMGTGRNALFLARNGYEVEGVDSSQVAVNRVRSFAQKASLLINPHQEDLTGYQIAENTYDVILNFYFLERSLTPSIKRGLKQGGVLLFETYTVEQPRYGEPHNPHFLLKPNELLHSFLDLHIIYYHERIDTQEGTPKAIASLYAQKR